MCIAARPSVRLAPSNHLSTKSQQSTRWLSLSLATYVVQWGAKYNSPQQQVAVLFSKIAGKYGTPGGEHYSVRPSSDFPQLPQPSTDLDVLQRDFLKWGYCLVKDALSPEEVAEATARLLDQSQAEQTAKVAQMAARNPTATTKVDRGSVVVSGAGSRQLVSNLISKGDIWRKIATYESHNGPTVGALMESILGKDLLLSSMHGVVVEQGSGAQGIHQDQAFPLPHPPFPTHANIIYMYTPWGLAEGGTYVIPGSATDENGMPAIVEGMDAEEYLANHEIGIVALCAPPGTCFVSDGRLLHAGAPRTAPGVRLGNNCYHCRAQMKQQENPYVSFCALDKASPKLMRMLFGSSRAEVGFAQLHTTPSGRVPVGELSMSRPEDFEGKDFDFYYTRQARQLVESGATTAEYRGPPREAKL